MNSFSPHSQMVLALARREADRLGHNYVGTEHLLLGIVALGQGGAVALLTKLGIKLEELRSETEKEIGTNPELAADPGPIPFTPRVKKLLALAARELITLGENTLDTEHVLLGILLEGEGLACRVLKRLGVDLETVQSHLKPLKTICTVRLSPEIMAAAQKLGMILDEYIEHLHKLHYNKGDTPA